MKRRFGLLILSLLLSCSMLFAQSYLDSIELSLKRTVNFLTDTTLMGRKAGSSGELESARYLYDRLSQAGVQMVVPRDGEDFYILLQDSIHSRNVIGIVPGYDKELKDEYVVIGAHIDHLGSRYLEVNGEKHLQIFRGADDNASGVATLIEVAKMISAQQFLFRRSVIFALFGAEELGMAGSWYFLNRSFKDVSNIVAMINLDMVGRSGRDNKLSVYTADGNIEIGAILKMLSARPLSIAPVHSPLDYFPSDHRLFYEKGIPIALFTSGIHRDYHSVRDTPDKLDYYQMEQLAEYIFSFAQNIANRDDRISIASKQTKEQREKDLYMQVNLDKRATFLHKDERQFLDKWVYKYIKYPDSALIEGIEGEVTVEFIVELDGSVSNVKIVKGLSEDIDKEVEKVIKASPKWKPGEIMGKVVRTKIVIPIEFKLAKTGTIKIKK